MKILKRGNAPTDRPIQAACRNCHSEIEFEIGEASVVSDPRDGDYLSIKCPVCGREITRNVRIIDDLPSPQDAKRADQA